MSSQRACKTLAAYQCASCVFLQNLHSVGGQPDANFIQPDANFNQPAASWMQIASG
jgi:hypothetical protein